MKRLEEILIKYRPNRTYKFVVLLGVYLEKNPCAPLHTDWVFSVCLKTKMATPLIKFEETSYNLLILYNLPFSFFFFLVAMIALFLLLLSLFECAYIHFASSTHKERGGKNKQAKKNKQTGKKQNKCYIKTGLSWSASLVHCKPPSMANKKGEVDSLLLSLCCLRCPPWPRWQLE